MEKTKAKGENCANFCQSTFPNPYKQWHQNLILGMRKMGLVMSFANFDIRSSKIEM